MTKYAMIGNLEEAKGRQMNYCTLRCLRGHADTITLGITFAAAREHSRNGKWKGKDVTALSILLLPYNGGSAAQCNVNVERMSQKEKSFLQVSCQLWPFEQNVNPERVVACCKSGTLFVNFLGIKGHDLIDPLV